MIGYILGKITYLDLTQVILETGGVGYEIRISINSYRLLKELKEVRLYTYLQIRDDAHVLYGFVDLKEKNLFILLISVSGVGPSTAMMMLSSMETNEIEEAIATSDVVTMKSIKGIGLKTAERIIVELKDKIRKEKGYDKNAEFLSTEYQTARNEALAALVTLGIQRSAAEKIIQSIFQKHGRDIPVEEIIKLALKSA